MRMWVVGLALFASACASSTRSEPRAIPVTGPDGLPALHVSCGTDEGHCYQLAGRFCPTGYDIEPTRGRAGNFLVHCRLRTWAAAGEHPLAPSPYALQETVQPWPGRDELAPSPYRPTPPPATTGYPPLAPGSPPGQEDRDLGF
jgi:hypothetical protein